jgi:uncharacterized protein
MTDPCQILQSARRIAVPGMSPKPERTSHRIAKFLMDAGYEVVPVNPGHDEILGLKCYASLPEIPDPVDIVDVFRAADHQHEIAEQVRGMKAPPKAVWFQLNAGGEAVAEGLRDSGMAVFVDSCIMVVHSDCGL